LTLAAPVRTATLLKDHLDDACRQREPHQDAGRANDPLGSVLAVPGLPLSLIRGLVGQAPATGALTASRPTTTVNDPTAAHVHRPASSAAPIGRLSSTLESEA
jgi:hypothetical protein